MRVRGAYDCIEALPDVVAVRHKSHWPMLEDDLSGIPNKDFRYGEIIRAEIEDVDFRKAFGPNSKGGIVLRLILPYAPAPSKNLSDEHSAYFTRELEQDVRKLCDIINRRIEATRSPMIS